MVGSTVAGLVMVGATFIVAGKSSLDDVFVAFMVETAAAFMLVALFFWLERKFIRTVARTVATQVQQQVAPLEAKVAALVTEVANLQGAVDERTEQQTAHHHTLVEALDLPTFASLTAALTEASRLSAIVDGMISVQANQDPRGIWLNFTYGADFSNGQRVSPNRLVVTAKVREEDHPKRYILDMAWGEDDRAEDVAERMRDRLRSAEVRQPRNKPDWTLALRNLQRSLDAALPLDDDSPWQLQGSLHELAGEDWAITKAGLQHRLLGMVIPAKDFPPKTFPFAKLNRPELEPQPWEPTKPESIDQDEWALVVERGRDRIARLGYSLERTIPHDPGSARVWVAHGTKPNI